ncbi:MAG: hypothetical protein ACSLFQ_03670 [Thermoanaerobaculia bacterium]
MPTKRKPAKKSVKQSAKKPATRPVKPLPVKKVARKAPAKPKPTAKKAVAKKVATKKSVSKKSARKPATSPRKRPSIPRISAALLELAKEVAAGEGVSVNDVLARVRFMNRMEGTTLEAGLREAKGWIGIDGDDLDEWAEKETCKCGRPMPGWWDRKAYPSKDPAEREYLWVIRRCACGFAPEEITGKLEPPKTRKK